MTPSRRETDGEVPTPAGGLAGGAAAVAEAQIRPVGFVWKRIAVIVGLLILLGMAIWMAIHFKLRTQVQEPLEQLLESLGIWKHIAFIVLYIIACVLLLPGSFLTLAAGAVFGLLAGAILVNIGATLGAVAAFLVGRYLARDWLARKIAGHPTFIAIDKAVADEGWKIVFLTRLCPVFPYFLLNYAYGLTRVSFREYFFATWIGIIPGSTLFVYIGSLAKRGEAPDTIWRWVVNILGLVAFFALTVYITRVARRALAQRIPINPTGGALPPSSPLTG